jgi:GntR family transcriptional repressor for pyruvate dehydrogenase complex
MHPIETTCFSGERGPGESRAPASKRVRKGSGALNAPVRTKAVDRTLVALRTAILTGHHPAGTPLPPERTLSQELGVSRLTLRAAIAHLEAEGLVHAVQGSGTLVLDVRQSGGLELLGPLLRTALADGSLPHALLRQVLELRRALAIEAVGLAAARAGDADLAALDAQLDQQRHHADDPDRFMREDLRFARLLLRAAHNLPLELLYNSVVRSLAAQQGAVILFVAPNVTHTLAAYGKLVELLRARDADRARRVARRLLERHDRQLLATLTRAVNAATPSPHAREAS